MMNKILFSLFFTISSFSLFADLYDEALKFEAKGDFDSYTYNLHQYFNENINDSNQDSIIEKLFYSSTLFTSIEETILLLETYVKYMKYPQSRYIIYNKLAQINELLGRIKDAGIYYEKAAYTVNDYIDYSAILNSIDMLIEMGYFEVAITKLLEIENAIDSQFRSRCYVMLCRLYHYTNEYNKKNYYFEKIPKTEPNYDFLKYEIGYDVSKEEFNKKSINYELVKNNIQRLKNPSFYSNMNSELQHIPYAPLIQTSEIELYVGSFEHKTDAAGIINIFEQMELPWFFDEYNNKWELYVFTNNTALTIKQLNNIGLILKDKNH